MRGEGAEKRWSSTDTDDEGQCDEASDEGKTVYLEAESNGSCQGRFGSILEVQQYEHCESKRKRKADRRQEGRQGDRDDYTEERPSEEGTNYGSEEEGNDFQDQWSHQDDDAQEGTEGNADAEADSDYFSG